MGAYWIRPGGAHLFCGSNRADCCAKLGQAQRLHDVRKRIGHGWYFDGVVGVPRCHVRFTLDSCICRTFDLALQRVGAFDLDEASSSCLARRPVVAYPFLVRPTM